jgi:signal transduction histidine kinase
MKSALIATISHELRTPAGTIHGYASMLEQELRERGADGQGSDVLLEFAEAVRTRAADLVRLVGDLTELSQLETGKVALQQEKIDVSEMLAACVRDFGDVPNAVPVVVDASTGLFARADRIRARHAFDRVLDNALKFTPEGRVDVRCARSGDRVLVEIVDTGVGIDPDHLDQVIDPFSQEDDPLTRRFEGAGLGLAIVRRVVELMGGELQIQSEKGEGTTVAIYLSAADPDESVSVA